MSRSVDLLISTLNSTEFKNRIITHPYDWTDVNCLGPMNGTEIFDHLYTSHPVMRMRLIIRKKGWRDIKFWFSGTLGYTNLNERATTTFNHWLSTNANDKCNVIAYASHLAHEICHQYGFCDKNYDQAKYRNVVPYAIGDIVFDLLKKQLNHNCNNFT